jgi:hypothetical protein
MKILVILLLAAPAAAQKPPVQVKVIVDEPEEGFFAEEKKPVAAEVNVPQAAAPAANNNTNTQVVTVVVNGANATPQATAEAKSEAPAVFAPVAPAPAAEPAVHAEVPRRKRWLQGEPGARRGSIMLSALGGATALGGYAGGAAEVLLGDRLGLRLAGMLNEIGGEHGEPAREGESDGEEMMPRMEDDEQMDGMPREKKVPWPRGGIPADQIESGRTHLEELSLTFHLLPGRRFDLFGGLGVAHYGFDLRGAEEQRERGGAIFGRANLGAGYFGSRFFANAGVTWLPVEIANYTVGERVEGGGQNVVFDQKKDPWNGRRVLFSATAGLRFN